MIADNQEILLERAPSCCCEMRGVHAYRYGMNQAWHSGQKEVTVQLTDRVVLSPFTAKRLAVLLQNVIRGYESRYGELDIGIRRPPTPGAPVS